MTIPPESHSVGTGNLVAEARQDRHPIIRCAWMLILAGAFLFSAVPGSPVAASSRTSTAAITPDGRHPSTGVEYISSKRKENAYDKIIMEAARRHDVHPALIKAIIKAESSYNPKAVSSKGARGLMQLMPSTARAMGVKNSFNPKHNIHGGTKYFKHLLDHFEGNIRMALAAYNAGIVKVKKYGRVPPFKATRSYIRKVITYYREYRTEMRMMARS